MPRGLRQPYHSTQASRGARWRLMTRTFSHTVCSLPNSLEERISLLPSPFPSFSISSLLGTKICQQVTLLDSEFCLEEL